MRRLYILYLAALCFAACIRVEIQEPYSTANQQAGIIYFTHRDYDKVNVTTKATLDLIPESRIQNMFIYIFDSNDKRIYAHYFDQSNKLLEEANISNKDINCWQVTNRMSNNPADTETSGYIKIKSPHCTDGTIYVVANIDADMVNISPEKLNTVRTVGDLENLSASLNQEITSRNGYFPMSFKSGIDINDDGTVTLDKEMQLVRLDAKVMVNFRVATDNELEKTEGEGQDAITTKQTLKEFIPESWRVVNIPKGSYVFEKNTDYDDAGYFDTEPVVFETKGTEEFTYTNGSNNYTVTSPVNGFSFYMVENRETASASTGGKYHLRDKREKDDNGRYTTDADGGIWVYAPEDGTYLEVKGEVVMVVDVSSEAKQQQLSAAVTYYIHLGDLTESMDNYSISRNTIYNYTITIKGVSEIETEVTTSNLSGVGPNHTDFKENETGATGQVYIAKESIYTFDAHYGQRVFCFDAAYIDPDNVTWYVKTPFGKEGVPEKVGDTEVPAGMDYKWVHFLLNSVEADGTYSHKNLPWPGDPYDGEKFDYYEDFYGINENLLMDVVEFTQFIKEEKRKFDKNRDDNPDNNVEEIKFLKEYDDEWRIWYNEKNGTSYSPADAKTMTDDKYPWWRYRMYVTVFVDEFYYEVDPISGEAREGLWKEFVNQPNRLMHILCDNEKSFDRESSATGSVITLRQRSIQTPYNLTHSETAWGCETVDEFRESYMWYFNENETRSNPGVGGLTTKGNNSENNGLSNTVKLLGIDVNGSVQWNRFIDYNRENDFIHSNYDYTIFFMQPGYVSLLYSILQRNRDNNGNGYIDPDEIRWYQAALEQVLGLYLGGLGLSEEAQLYPPSVADYAKNEVFPTGHPFAGMHKWMLKIVSSTCRPPKNPSSPTSSESYTLPVTVWAEEGVSTSHYKRSFAIDWGIGTQSPYSVRCIRNLGLQEPDATTILDEDENVPDPLITAYFIESSSSYRFDLRNINEKSLRFYTTKELEPGDENSEMSRLFYGFETGSEKSVSGGYDGLKTMLEAGSSACPKGWRTPNLREGILMYMYGSADWWDNWTMVSTWISLGKYGTGSDKNKKDGKESWSFGENFASIGETTSYVRCVRDSDPSTW